MVHLLQVTMVHLLPINLGMCRGTGDTGKLPLEYWAVSAKKKNPEPTAHTLCTLKSVKTQSIQNE